MPNSRGAKQKRYKEDTRGLAYSKHKKDERIFILACSTNYNKQKQSLIKEKCKCGNVAHIIGIAKAKHPRTYISAIE